jgi:N-acetyl-gamma-glutamyl-phosphate reductase
MTTTIATNPSTAPSREAPARTVTAGVLGASGTSGVELIRLLEGHPGVRLAFATSRSHAGERLDGIDPAAPPVELRHPDDVDTGEAEVVFLCVPHGTAGGAARLWAAAGARVIDVSGDHRLRDAALHARVYGSARSQELADGAVYGLTELVRERLVGCRVVANPGCYATAAGLALAPLAEAGLLHGLPVIDAKSGVSGAGREPTDVTHFCSAAGDVRPYAPGRAHRHVAEIEQLLAAYDPAEDRPVVFTPHLVPIERGIEATIVVGTGSGGADAVRDALERTYDGEPFVRVLPPGSAARVRAVVGTNRADLAVFPVEDADAAVVTVAIDNLLKGAAGQAVQNMNVLLGFPEELGLPGAHRA